MKKITLLFTLFAFSFGFSQNGGDDCANSVVALAGSFTGTTINDVTPGTNNGDSAWFVYTATGDGTIEITSCGDPNTTDTRLFTFDGTCAILNSLLNDDDGCPTGPNTFSSVIAALPVVNGTDYYIQWDDRWSVDPFDWTLTFTPPPTCGEPTGVVATPLDTSSDFSWTVPALGIPTDYNWEIQPDGVAQGTAGALAFGTEFGSTVNSGPVLTASTDYEFYVQTNCGGDLSTFATIGFTTSAGPPPANDDFANATPVACGGNYTGDTSVATLDEDDAPDGFGANLDAPNIWYSYDSAVQGAADVTIDLCASGYDTSFLVYTGTSGNLTLVFANDDNPGVCGAGFRSYGTFTADGTQTYFITVEGYNPGASPATGSVDMTVTCVASCTPAQANQDCASAVSLTVDGSTILVDNTCATLNANTVTCNVFNPIADVWYSFVAPLSGQVDITTALGTATEADITVYSGTCGALVEEACQDTAATANTVNLTGLVIGDTYYLQLWNNGGASEGTFDVTLTEVPLSIGEIENENAFTYYPNPVKNSLTLKAVNEIQNVSIYNMLGQEVLRTAPNAIEKDIDMSSLQTGTYFVQVTINNVTETVRIIKQ